MIIDCGTNIKLFLAIAALNDTDDYGQCFVVMEEYLTQSLRLVEKGEVQKNITLRKLTPCINYSLCIIIKRTKKNFEKQN